MFKDKILNQILLFKRKKSVGISLILVIFIALVSFILITSIMAISSSNTRQISNDTEGKKAYYAAEAGISAVSNFYNSDFTNWKVSLASSGLPQSGTPAILSNGASYWIDSISYIDSNKIAVVNVIGKSKDAYRKIRARISTSIPKYFNDYGLLTNGVLTIHGKKILDMDIHANDGLVLMGPTTMQDGTVATQSDNPDAPAPDPTTNPIGGYVSPVDVPMVPISDLKEATQAGINLDINQSNLNTQIANAPEGSYIYISNLTNSSHPNNTITLSGNMGSKVIFVDQDVTVNASGISNLSDVMIISSGKLTVNGSVDFMTSHPGEIDTVFASDGDITLNGSRKFQALFWTNGSFTQNGSSMAGRVIAQSSITFNGAFTLSASNKLFDYGAFDNIATVSSWQQISMDQ